MDVVMTRLLLTRAQAAPLPPEQGMGYEWWEPALRHRVQAWFERRDTLQDEIQRRKELAEKSSSSEEEQELEEEEAEEDGQAAKVEEEGREGAGDGSTAAADDDDDGSVPLLEGDSLVDLSLPAEAWRAQVGKGSRVYGQDSVGDWWKVNIVSTNDEFCIKNEEFCIKNEELCIKNEEFCI